MAKVLFQGGVEVVRHEEGGVWQAWRPPQDSMTKAKAERDRLEAGG
jgi:hypothetical protein